MFKNKFILPFLFFGIGFFLASCAGDKSAQKTGGQRGQNVFPVRVVVVQPGPISLVYNATGTFRAFEEVEITAERAGRIDRLNFLEGQNVQKNAPLAYINDDEVSSQIRTLEVQLQNAETKLERAQKLKTINAVSQEELDDLLFEKERIASSIKELEVIRQKSVIRAPFSGKLGFRNISPGAYVNAGQKIVDLVAYHPLKATFNIPEEYAHQVNEKDSIIVKLNGNISRQTIIDRISPKVDPANRSFTARALIDNKDASILPGSFANIELPVYDNPDALLLPAEAIIQKLGGTEIFIVKDGKAKSTNIETGVRNENFVEVTQGVSVGDSVVITGLLSLSDGVPVSATATAIKKDTE